MKFDLIQLDCPQYGVRLSAGSSFPEPVVNTGTPEHAPLPGHRSCRSAHTRLGAGAAGRRPPSAQLGPGPPQALEGRREKCREPSTRLAEHMSPVTGACPLAATPTGQWSEARPPRPQLWRWDTGWCHGQNAAPHALATLPPALPAPSSPASCVWGSPRVPTLPGPPPAAAVQHRCQ